jgi:23S rRNA pseudouridine2605 synthase
VEERLQKLLAEAGVASRRASEALIAGGHVTVNGRVVREPGARADPARDDVRVDGRRVRPAAAHTYLALSKPPGYTTTVADPHATRTVMELLPPGTPRVFPVGRLDRDSEGLLLLTNDGELAARLIHPRYHVAKEYAVLVRGPITEQALRRLREGVQVDGERTAPAEVEPGEPPSYVRGPGTVEREQAPRRSTPPRARSARPPASPSVWLRFVLREGRKRQIREMCRQVGLEVERLIRTRVGPLHLGNLRPGQVRPLTPEEITRLRRATGLVEHGSPQPPERPGRPPDRTPHAPTQMRPRGGRPRQPEATGRAPTGRKRTSAARPRPPRPGGDRHPHSGQPRRPNAPPSALRRPPRRPRS